MGSSQVSARSFTLALALALGALTPWYAAPLPAAEPTPAAASDLAGALERARENRAQIEQALQAVPADQRPGMEFLIANMPERDLQSLSAEFLLENVDYSYRAWNESPWKARVPEQVFLSDVLPYASINERRDRWRKDFFERFRLLVAGIDSPGLAAARLNQRIFGLLDVKYSTKRPKADQSPYESIDAHLASCTGLSVLLVDACRAVGVPARLVGTPRWTDNSGNHTWVEVWDDGWHFTGAAEPAGDKLDDAWFVQRAAQARPDDPRHAIYAASYRKTGLKFPLLWARNADYVQAVDVTASYLTRSEKLPPGYGRAMLRFLDQPRGERRTAQIQVCRPDGQVVFEGTTKDERADANDHLTVVLPLGQEFAVTAQVAGKNETAQVRFEQDNQLFTLAAADAPAESAKAGPVAALESYFAKPAGERPPLAEQEFAKAPLSKADAEAARKLLWADHAARIRAERAQEVADRKLKLGELEMPFTLQTFGEKPASGRSLFISMHGGGNAPPQVNDRQWSNQQKLYEPAEGIYVAPRAPTNTWNLWHEPHVDAFFARLIEDLIVLEEVDPNRVYLMGYSAGGDGVFQLAPRMADRLAAAAMMAGHPNETKPQGLRNIGFALFMGGKDAAYRRNEVAREWETKLAELKAADPAGYEHLVKIFPDKGHWMDHEDAMALPWLAKFTREPLPKKIVWRQDDVTHGRFYWLAVDEDQRRGGSQVVATVDGQQIDLASEGVERLRVRLADGLVDLDQPVKITAGERVLYEGTPPRTIALLAQTLAERGDPAAVFATEVEVTGLAPPTKSP